jgi:fermentation-respiration switch protein FrsA (DUF1100 family)
MTKHAVRFLTALALLYLGTVGFMYMRQRDFLYHPGGVETSPAGNGLPQAQSIELQTSDGEHIVAWWVPPARENAPVFLYLHGNAGTLARRAGRFGKMVSDGSGLLAIDWRGYGGSTGSPSQAGLLQDALAAYNWLTARLSPKQIIVFGESLGTSPATWLASKQPVAALVLDSPFMSALTMARTRYWFLPLDWLLKDTYRSDLWMRQVSAPVLVMHGDADPVVPFSQGKALFALAPEPKEFHTFAGGGHIVAYDREGMEIVQSFIRKYTSH